FQAEDGIRDDLVTGVQTCALPIYHLRCSIDLPPQPTRAQLSLVLGAAAIRLAAGKKRVADQAPAATAVRLRNERRFNVGFMLCKIGRASCRERVLISVG